MHYIFTWYVSREQCACCSLASFFCKFWRFQGRLQKVTNTRDVFWEVGRKVLSAPGNKDKLWATFEQSGKKRIQLKHGSTNTVANHLTKEGKKKRLFCTSSFLSRALFYSLNATMHIWNRNRTFFLQVLQWFWKAAGKWWFLHLCVVGLMLIFLGWLPDSNLLANVTLFPNRQYLGIFTPTTPASTDPLWRPIRIWRKKDSAPIHCIFKRKYATIFRLSL